ncbi:MAG: hypothetical protein LBJ20_06280 [Candidatus Methanoplasma sp.]|nr:hypothetical protein [Candidatus Methanoplasma sp.]
MYFVLYLSLLLLNVSRGDLGAARMIVSNVALSGTLVAAFAGISISVIEANRKKIAS